MCGISKQIIQCTEDRIIQHHMWKLRSRVRYLSQNAKYCSLWALVPRHYKIIVTVYSTVNNSTTPFEYDVGQIKIYLLVTVFLLRGSCFILWLNVGGNFQFDFVSLSVMFQSWKTHYIAAGKALVDKKIGYYRLQGWHYLVWTAQSSPTFVVCCSQTTCRGVDSGVVYIDIVV